MTDTLLLEYFDDLLVTPENAEQLNRTILQLAIQGKLTHREAGDKSAKELLSHIRTERENLGKAKPIQDIDQSEYPFDIPDDWEWVRLGDLVKKIGAGSTPKGGKEVYTDSGTKFIRSQNVWNEGLYLDDVAFISDAINEKMSGTVVEAKDLLLNITGASIARCALVPDDFDSGNVNQHVMIIRLIEPEIRKFIHICMTSPYIYNLIMSVQVGMSREGLSIGKLEKFVLPFPPLAEQQRIVARVEELFVQTRALAMELAHSQSELDGLNQSALSHLLASETPEEFNQHWEFIAEHFDLLFQAPEHVAPLRQSILELAVRGKLTRREAGDESAKVLLERIGEQKKKPIHPINDNELRFELPDSWVWTSLDDISRLITDGTHVTPSYLYDGVPFLSVKDVSKGYLDFSSTRFISEEEHKKLSSRCKPELGDVLLTKVGTTGIALVVDTDREFSIFVSIALLKIFQNEVLPDYLSLVINSPFVKRQSDKYTMGVGNKNLVLKHIKNFLIPLPPVAEQERIVKRVEQLLNLCDALEAHLQSAEEERGRLVRAVMAGVGAS